MKTDFSPEDNEQERREKAQRRLDEIGETLSLLYKTNSLTVDIMDNVIKDFEEIQNEFPCPEGQVCIECFKEILKMFKEQKCHINRSAPE